MPQLAALQKLVGEIGCELLDTPYVGVISVINRLQ
jgi:hypothetical protein